MRALSVYKQRCEKAEQRQPFLPQVQVRCMLAVQVVLQMPPRPPSVEHASPVMMPAGHAAMPPPASVPPASVVPASVLVPASSI